MAQSIPKGSKRVTKILWDLQRFWPHLRSKRRCISGPNGFRCRRNRRGAAPFGFEGTGEVVSASSSVSGSVGNFSRRERSTRGELGGSAPLGSLKTTATDCDRKGVSGVWPPTWAKCLENPQPLTRPMWTMTAPGRTANSKRVCRAFGPETPRDCFFHAGFNFGPQLVNPYINSNTGKNWCRLQGGALTWHADLKPTERDKRCLIIASEAIKSRSCSFKLSRLHNFKLHHNCCQWTVSAADQGGVPVGQDVDAEDADHGTCELPNSLTGIVPADSLKEAAQKNTNSKHRRYRSTFLAVSGCQNF